MTQPTISMTQDLQSLCEGFFKRHGKLPAEIQVDDVHLEYWETTAYDYLKAGAVLDSEYANWFAFDVDEVLPVISYRPKAFFFIQDSKKHRIPIVYGQAEFKASWYQVIVSEFWVSQEFDTYVEKVARDMRM